MKTNRKLLIAAVLLGVILSSAGIVSAAFLFRNSFPPVPQSQVFAHCQTLKSIPAFVGSSQGGHVFFTCAYPWTHSFHSQPNASAMPGFNRPGPYWEVNIVPLPYSDAPSCAEIAGAVKLTSSVFVSFPSTFTEWDYCLEYGQVGSEGLPGFSIEWQDSS